jgi:hypothetical protein
MVPVSRLLSLLWRTSCWLTVTNEQYHYIHTARMSSDSQTRNYRNANQQLSARILRSKTSTPNALLRRRVRQSGAPDRKVGQLVSSHFFAFSLLRPWIRMDGSFYSLQPCYNRTCSVCGSGIYIIVSAAHLIIVTNYLRACPCAT